MSDHTGSIDVELTDLTQDVQTADSDPILVVTVCGWTACQLPV